MQEEDGQISRECFADDFEWLIAKPSIKMFRFSRIDTQIGGENKNGTDNDHDLPNRGHDSRNQKLRVVGVLVK